MLIVAASWTSASSPQPSAPRPGLTQLSLAGSMLKMNAQNASSVVKLIDAAQQTMNSLANLAPGVGTSLDISV